MTSAFSLDLDIALSGTQDGIDNVLGGGRQYNDCWSVSQAEVVRLSKGREAGRIGEADGDVLGA